MTDETALFDAWSDGVEATACWTDPTDAEACETAWETAFTACDTGADALEVGEADAGDDAGVELAGTEGVAAVEAAGTETDAAVVLTVLTAVDATVEAEDTAEFASPATPPPAAKQCPGNARTSASGSTTLISWPFARPRWPMRPIMVALPQARRNQNRVVDFFSDQGRSTTKVTQSRGSGRRLNAVGAASWPPPPKNATAVLRAT